MVDREPLLVLFKIFIERFIIYNNSGSKWITLKSCQQYTTNCIISIFMWIGKFIWNLYIYLQTSPISWKCLCIVLHYMNSSLFVNSFYLILYRFPPLILYSQTIKISLDTHRSSTYLCKYRTFFLSQLFYRTEKGNETTYNDICMYSSVCKNFAILLHGNKNWFLNSTR